MKDIQTVKIEIFIPEEFVEVLRYALNEAGAGHIGNYDHCLSIIQVTGYWRPLEGADPFEGEIGKIYSGHECKVEVNCPVAAVPAALRAARKVHPYEEPVINVVPLMNGMFEGGE